MRENCVSGNSHVKGLPAVGTRASGEASGEFVYIATSDDAMAPDCLEKLVAALEQHNDCDLAHCPLVVVDENGAPVAQPRWPDGQIFGDSVPGLGEPDRTSAMHPMTVCCTLWENCLCLGHAIAYPSVVVFTNRRFSIEVGIGWRFQLGNESWLGDKHDPRSWYVGNLARTSQAGHYFGESLLIEHEQKVEEMIEDAIQSCEKYLGACSVLLVAGLRSHWLDSARVENSITRRYAIVQKLSADGCFNCHNSLLVRQMCVQN